MPTYVYKFLETGETIEVQQSFDDPTLTEATHPVTGITMAVKKVFLPVGVTFKGDGFYKTDSRSTAKSSSGSAGSADPAGSSSPDSATTANAPSGSSSPDSATTANAPSSASPGAGPASSSTSSSD